MLKWKEIKFDHILLLLELTFHCRSALPEVKLTKPVDNITSSSCPKVKLFVLVLL